MFKKNGLMIMKKIKEYALFFLLAYIAAICAIYTMQNKLLYFPSANVPLAKNWKEIKNANQDAVLGYQLNRFDSKKTIILFHGNAGSAADRVYYQNIFPSNINLIIAEYPGFGANFHQETNHVSVMSQARELVAKYSQDPGKELIIAGESLGTGVASHMAKEFSSSKLMLFTPYSSIADVAQDRYWWAPVQLLLRDNYNTMEAVLDYPGKTLVVLSGKDNVIPVKFGKKVLASIKNAKEIMVENAGHTNWWVYMKPEQKKEFLNFL